MPEPTMQPLTLATILRLKEELDEMMPRAELQVGSITRMHAWLEKHGLVDTPQTVNESVLDRVLAPLYTNFLGYPVRVSEAVPPDKALLVQWESKAARPSVHVIDLDE